MNLTNTDNQEMSVLFVDLVRFTSLTDVHGDLAGADAASALESVGRKCLNGGARLVKTLGDGILLTTPDPTSALESAVCILEGLHNLQIGIDARCGAHHGPVVVRGEDVFGSTVNLAARSASLARPGHIVVTRPLAETASALELSAAPLGKQIVGGFVDPIELFELDLCEHDADWTADPVCGMRLRSDDVTEHRVHDDRSIGFCSRRCAEIFDAAPSRFA